MDTKQPIITALMISKGNINLVRESYNCFVRQNYPAKRLLIVTDCTPKVLRALIELTKNNREVSILHVKDKLTLGELRNLSLKHSPSDLTIQWDDDDWFAPNRMSLQYLMLHNKTAVLLTEQLHYFRNSNEVALIKDFSGIEGTILLNRASGFKYPSLRAGEDTVLKQELVRKNAVTLVSGGFCYCRTYHGNNTWDLEHHLQRVTKLQQHAPMSFYEEAAKIYSWPPGWKILTPSGRSGVSK